MEYLETKLTGVMQGAIAAFIIASVTVLVCGLLFGIACDKLVNIVAWVIVLTLIGAVSGKIYLE